MREYEAGPDGVFRVLELPERGAPYDVNEAAFMDRGACRSHDPALFDTNTAKGCTSLRGSVRVAGEVLRKRDQIEKAREVCRACPVLSACAAFIKQHPEPEGIWAATLPEERGQA